MPYKLKRGCRNPRCPKLAIYKGYCEDHKQKDNRVSADKRGYGSKWRIIRSQYLKANPTCKRCGIEATEVHHIIPIKKGGSNKWSNLEALCKSCHSKQTAKHDGGFGKEKN